MNIKGIKIALLITTLTLSGISLGFNINTVRATELHILDNATGGDCITIGIWDDLNNICTLTNNVSGTIHIDSDGITLDGNSFFINTPTIGINVLSSGNVIINNIIYSGEDGIVIYGSNNTLENNTIQGNAGVREGFGVRFVSGSQGNDVISNTINRFLFGIYGTADYDLISQNQVRESIYGINLSGSYSILNNNTIDPNGTDSFLGLSLGGATGFTLSNNIVYSSPYKNSFSVSGDSDASFDHNIDTSNLVDSKPIYYIKNAIGLTFDSSTNAGVFYCISCSNVVIKDLNLTNNLTGVFLWETTQSTVENNHRIGNSATIWLKFSTNNTIKWNATEIFLGDYSDNNLVTENNISGTSSSRGIKLSYSSNNSITNNTLADNYGGIDLSSSTNNTITNNTLTDNAWATYSYAIALSTSDSNYIANNTLTSNSYGITMDTSDSNYIANNTLTSNSYGINLVASDLNRVYNNNFIDNSVQAQIDSVLSNIFYLNKPTGGNYWSNFDTFEEGCINPDGDDFCNASYNFFDGGKDKHPWVIPNGWLL